MEGLPPELDQSNERVVTGLSCVECPGVVQARTQGELRQLEFECRVGHKYSAHELVAGKEKRLEEFLWACMLGIEELRVLLADLGRFEEQAGLRANYEKRILRLETQARAIRQLIDENDPVDLTPSGPAAEREDQPAEGKP